MMRGGRSMSLSMETTTPKSRREAGWLAVGGWHCNANKGHVCAKGLVCNICADHEPH